MGIIPRISVFMRNIFLTFFLMISFSWSFAQLNQTDSKGRKQGDWIKYYPNSKHMEYKGKFVDGKPTGIFYYYFFDGGIKMIAKHNPISGRSEAYFYHDSKALKTFGVYRNMKKDSIWTFYSNTGIVSGRESYKNDLLEGMSTTYYVNGMKPGTPSKVVEQIPYVKGKKQGEAKEFFVDGSLMKDYFYANDKLNGWYKTYNPGGTLASVSYFYNDRRHGKALTVTTKGKEISYFINGEFVSKEDFHKWLDNCNKKRMITHLPKSYDF